MISQSTVASDDTSRTSRRPVAVVAGIFVIVVAALVVSIAAAHVRPTGHSHTTRGEVGAPPGLTLTHTNPSLPPQRKLTPNAATGIIGGLLFVAGVLILGAIIFFMLRGLYHLLRSLHLAILRRRRPIVPSGELAPPDLAQQMSDAVEDALDELDVDRPVSDSIILCWQRLRTAAAEAGVPTVSSDTPDEAIRRIFFATEVSGTPLRTLAELYREARFSRHTMGPGDVVTARGALTAIMVDLRDEAGAEHDARV